MQNISKNYYDNAVCCSYTMINFGYKHIRNMCVEICRDDARSVSFPKLPGEVAIISRLSCHSHNNGRIKNQRTIYLPFSPVSIVKR